MNATDTIVAQATPPGRGGVGIIRISGPDALSISEKIVSKILKPRYADYLSFYDVNNLVLDQGIAIYFKGPNSFTGEDVVELQGHGGPVIMDMLLQTVVQHGARIANPGEFSERAFLNDKLDLAQAEAIADLIESSSEQAARSALRSLQGDFSKRVHDLVEALKRLRIYVEASIDFPDEEIDFLSDGKVEQWLLEISQLLNDTLAKAQQGALLRDGMSVVIAGRPNAGKSSLLNALSGKESAIVTDIPGTTRDVLKEQITIDGMPLHIIDTAGLRQSDDKVEQIGVERAWKEIEQADRILLVVDSNEVTLTDPLAIWPEFFQKIPSTIPVTLIRNKSDLSGLQSGVEACEQHTILNVSAKAEDGIDALRQHLKDAAGYQATNADGFSARRRHITALENASESVSQAKVQLLEYNAGELVAEDLLNAQNELNTITGEFSSDDLLGLIFSSFCIGK
jgi:tRNA modification GTPase